MPEPASVPTDADVLALVRDAWSADVDAIEQLPPGAGAYHWKAFLGFRPVLFVTLDAYDEEHTAASLEAAYAGAAELAFRLDFVVAGLPSDALRYTVALACGALSVTPWVHGQPPTDDRATAEDTRRMLERLHAATPPRGLPLWTPPDPALSGAATTWVATHGEPHPGHQLITPVRTLLVHWRSLRLAPASGTCGPWPIQSRGEQHHSAPRSPSRLAWSTSGDSTREPRDDAMGARR